ncbi:MAG: serine acetyltransferase [Nocardioidaceae bacterium]|nr:serine acetyltransferase [Nocardioidaceae bacterium]
MLPLDPDRAVEARVRQIARRHLAQDDQALVARAAGLGRADLDALVQRDPASHRDWRYVLSSYGGLEALLAHRLAHAIWSSAPAPLGTPGPEHVLARQISEHAKVRTGVEIHPAARIGPGFVVDHGYGTVIGETTTIGADCYVLQGVVLGATGIADNRPGQRHPTLGDRVEVGAFARVLGPVRVGDGAFIGAMSLVLDDVPAGTRVHPGEPTIGRSCR